MHLALNYEMSLFPSHFSVLLHSLHGHIGIKSCNIPNLYDTYFTFMTLHCIVLTTSFYKKQQDFTRSVQQKIKAPVKVNPFYGFCFLIGQDCCALNSQYLAEQAPGCMHIRYIITYSILGRKQMPYTFQSN